MNQKIVRAVQRIANGSDEKLTLGNIDVKKEFNYAGDMVEAVWTMVNQDKVFEVVLGCGKAYSIRQWVDYCFSKINKRWQDHVVLRDDYIPEYDILLSDPTLLYSLAWAPKVDFYQLADLMMNENNLLADNCQTT